MTYPAPSDPVNALTRADGTTEAHSADHGRIIGIWENVLHHGARADALTDDSAAFAAAIQEADSAGGGTVFVPPGRYSIQNTIQLKADVDIRGAGTSTQLLQDVPDGGWMFEANALGPIASVTMQHLQLGGSPQTDRYSIGQGGGIYYHDVPSGGGGLVLRNVTFAGFTGPTSWCLKNENCLETMVETCHVYYCNGGGFYFTGNCNASVIRDCKMSDSQPGTAGVPDQRPGMGGINIESVGGMQVVGNVVEGWRGDYGIRVYGSVMTNLTGNWLEDNNGDSIQSSSSHGIYIFGNEFFPNRPPGGGAADSSAIKFIGPHFTATVAGNRFGDGTVLLCTDPATLNGCNYLLMGNIWTGGVLNDSTDATRDTVVMIGDRDQTSGGDNTHRGFSIYEGPLDHRGDKVGFFGTTPATRPTGYSQTYSATSRVNPSVTSANVATDASTTSSPYGYTSQSQADAIPTQINATQADLLAVKKLLNSVIDDLQAYGLLQ